MFTFAVIINTLNMEEKLSEPNSERLSKRNSICNLYADSIYKTNPGRDQIVEVMHRIFDQGYIEGYDNCSTDRRRQKEFREFKLNEDFLRFRTEIEDKIHLNK